MAQADLSWIDEAVTPVDALIIATVVFIIYRLLVAWYKSKEPERRAKKYERGRACALNILNGSSDLHIVIGRAATPLERAEYLYNKIDESACFGTKDEFDAGVRDVLYERNLLMEQDDGNEVKEYERAKAT